MDLCRRQAAHALGSRPRRRWTVTKNLSLLAQRVFAGCVVLGWVVWGPIGSLSRGASSPEEGEALQYGPPELLGHQDGRQLVESSGLAVSRLQPEVLWTHNDSGHGRQLFAQDLQGRLLATFQLSDAASQDWEDICSFMRDGKAYLMVGDIGDNGRKRDQGDLYVLPEPPLTAKKKLPVWRKIRFVYEDGPQDCESLAFDPVEGTIFLASKTWIPGCQVYAMPWPEDAPGEPLVARAVARLPLSGVTGMDISPDGRRAILVTYTDAFEFSRGAGEAWREAFARPPRRVPLPPRRQGEAICYGSDGATLFANSEGEFAPIFRLAPQFPGE